jgi:hypothetical protein
VLARDRAAVVDHHARTGHTHHRGRASAAAVARLDAALVGCGFPEHRRPPFVVPDSAICAIEVERGGETQWLSAAERDLRPQPGYPELLDGLEELVRAITRSPPAR